MTRGLRGVALRRDLLDPRRTGFYAVQLASHKVLRRMMAFPLLAIAASAPCCGATACSTGSPPLGGLTVAVARHRRSRGSGVPDRPASPRGPAGLLPPRQRGLARGGLEPGDGSSDRSLGAASSGRRRTSPPSPNRSRSRSRRRSPDERAQHPGDPGRGPDRRPVGRTGRPALPLAARHHHRPGHRQLRRDRGDRRQSSDWSRSSGSSACSWPWPRSSDPRSQR